MGQTSDFIRLLVARWACAISDSSNAKRDSSSVMACCFLSQIFQDGQCLRAFCAPSLGILQEMLSSFDNSLPKQGNMVQIQSWIISPTQSDSCTCIQVYSLVLYQTSKSACCAADCAACCAVGGAVRGVAVIALLRHVIFSYLLFHE